MNTFADNLIVGTIDPALNSKRFTEETPRAALPDADSEPLWNTWEDPDLAWLRTLFCAGSAMVSVSALVLLLA